MYNMDPWGGSDFALCPHAYISGRRIWFQPEKKEWLDSLSAQTANNPDSEARMGMLHNNRIALGELSEWVEEKSRDWDRRPGVKEQDVDGLGAHFALSVAAAGWHSGALVLVNRDLEEAVKQSCIGQPVTAAAQVEEHQQTAHAATQSPDDTVYSRITGFVQRIRSVSLSAPADEPEDGYDGPEWIWAKEKLPRLKLSNGEVMPGNDSVSDWCSPYTEWMAKLRFNPTTNTRSVFNIKGWSLV